MKQHEFKRRRGFNYIVIADCIHCGLIRKGTKESGYEYWREGEKPKEYAGECTHYKKL